ncbi:sensor histidine kinase [Zhihengliuella flava]|uniref:Two-component system sensor histidine kinase DesK n=1 Tax=Zhihengliuella flava TaxID=1285193 RepID=A0A931D5P0_9MICC|nr:histidine kinase [Zhihengliuella flava]MBG6084175.1 two-component system sensor histidine kinase DesK [Zhihengliuella flava]
MHHHPVSPRALSTIWWWTWVSIVFLYTVLYLATAAQLARASTSGVLLSIQLALLLAAALPAYLSSLEFRQGLPDAGPVRWRTLGPVAVPAALLAASSFVGGGLPALIPAWLAVSHVACLLPRGLRARGFWGGAVAVLGLAALLMLVTPPATWWPPMGAAGPNTTSMVVFYVLCVPLLVVGSVWWWDAVERLRRGRAAEAQLAATRERLRIAADLHDIQGHHLQVIALQAELAERLLAKDPAAAAEHVRTVRAAAAEAMGETRAVVSGLRTVGFAAELENAADVLGAAGIDCRVTGWGRELVGEAREVLGWVIREASTNILRHARPTRVDLTLETRGGRAALTVTNDGVANADTVPTLTGRHGSGLAGLRDRVMAAGGTFAAAREGERFVVRAEVPAMSEVRG